MKFRKIAATLALSAALALGFALPAFAADADYGVGDETDKTVTADAAAVTKVLHSNEGSTVTATFSFTATGTTVAIDDEGTVSEPTDGLGVTIASVELTTAGDGEDVSGTGKITFPAYTHAGVYAYMIEEAQQATIVNDDGSEGTMTYSTDKYLMRVYVENEDTGVAIKAVTFEKNPSATSNGEKVDGGDVKFENTFVEKTDDSSKLTIDKQVTGGSGDKTKEWEFTVTFAAPEYVPTGWTVNDIVMVGDATGTVADGKVTFKLTHGQSVNFTNVVAGTTYTVTETESGKDGYTTTGEVTTATVVSDKGPNTATITNNKEPITPTGLVLNNAPFILMALVAVGGVVAYGALKRKLTA
ncbi:Pilus backbone structural protein [Slackia heliotrinireducens]|uniref:Sortase B QVPTGV class signal domain-containing protein n=1 Tax=Slackia heliotrinireducens (strain ATCC 29202 / DSM 20476 / NCTC 11029 / RHS 1) TaxID=471855 RepID=C7N0P0_SLAHD|nr:QVPTGV class sortase B protein-sorting domain-containing protein [Slackia heliotrinireducens]ACV21118.1 sortase B QVPTGV class signal domain-containing protein [Slackia heliotrinireducens DSM 20476]VEH03636.1 Pilus backbone structural protein [Slackia heliotrinireducens]